MPVEVTRRSPAKMPLARRLRRVALAILDITGKAETELSLVLIGNAEMQRLNAKYRKKNYPTDVLSFPVEGIVPTKTPLLGDVIISVDKAGEQAKDRGHSLERETILLLIHGIVHLLGYDHERSATAARAMARLEKRVDRELCERGIIKV